MKKTTEIKDIETGEILHTHDEAIEYSLLKVLYIHTQTYRVVATNYCALDDIMYVDVLKVVL